MVKNNSIRPCVKKLEPEEVKTRQNLESGWMWGFYDKEQIKIAVQVRFHAKGNFYFDMYSSNIL